MKTSCDIGNTCFKYSNTFQEQQFVKKHFHNATAHLSSRLLTRCLDPQCSTVAAVTSFHFFFFFDSFVYCATFGKSCISDSGFVEAFGRLLCQFSFQPYTPSCSVLCFKWLNKLVVLFWLLKQFICSIDTCYSMTFSLKPKWVRHCVLSRLSVFT